MTYAERSTRPFGSETGGVTTTGVDGYVVVVSGPFVGVTGAFGGVAEGAGVFFVGASTFGLVVMSSFTIVNTMEPVAVEADAPFGVKSTNRVTSIKRFFAETGVSAIELLLFRKWKGKLQNTVDSEEGLAGEATK